MKQNENLQTLEGIWKPYNEPTHFFLYRESPNIRRNLLNVSSINSGQRFRSHYVRKVSNHATKKGLYKNTQNLGMHVHKLQKRKERNTLYPCNGKQIPFECLPTLGQWLVVTEHT